jgi:hypothetical protein
VAATAANPTVSSTTSKGGTDRPAEASATPEQDAPAPAVADPAASDAKPDAKADAKSDAKSDAKATATAKDGQDGAGAGTADSAQSDQDVTVVPGVPRYHRSECILIRFMGDSDLQRMPVERAREAGCTPCRACQPDGDEDE